MMRVPLEKPDEVLAVSSDTEDYHVALEKIAQRVVEDIVRETAPPQQVAKPRTSTRTFILKTDEDSSTE